MRIEIVLFFCMGKNKILAPFWHQKRPPKSSKCGPRPLQSLRPASFFCTFLVFAARLKKPNGRQAKTQGMSSQTQRLSSSWATLWCFWDPFWVPKLLQNLALLQLKKQHVFEHIFVRFAHSAGPWMREQRPREWQPRDLFSVSQFSRSRGAT